MVFTLNLRFAYVSCAFDGQIGVYSVGQDGALHGIGHVALAGAFGIAIAPDGRTLYVVSQADETEVGDTLSVFSVGADGSLTLVDRVLSGADHPKAVAVTPDGRFVYISHGAPSDTADSRLTGFALNLDGTVRGQVASVTNGISGFEIVITPNGRLVYVVSSGSGQVFGYHIAPDGQLLAVPGGSSPSGEFSFGAAMSPDGRRMYVAALGQLRAPPGEITGWDIDSGGALTQVEHLEVDGDPAGIEFAPDGRHLFVSDFSTNEITALRGLRNGQLRPIRTLRSGGPDPAFQSVSILPNVGPTASFTAEAAAGQSVHFDARASTDADGRVASFVWDFGDGISVRHPGPTAQHVYDAAGNYQVRLTVIDDEGCSVGRIFTGQSASCVGNVAASITRIVVVP